MEPNWSTGRAFRPPPLRGLPHFMLTASDVTEVLREITSLLRGGWIQKIQQPTDRTLVLDVRVPGRTHRLLVSCQPDLARLHVTTHSPINPPTPPPFCQF